MIIWKVLLALARLQKHSTNTFCESHIANSPHMIREKTYYLTTLLLPIVLSLLSLACAQFGVLRELPRFLPATMIVGGLPYLLTLLVLGFSFFA